jgi:hypothetical protein
VVEGIALMLELQELLGLEAVPYVTTLQKFFCRVRSGVFDVLLMRVVWRCAVDRAWIAIDGTGHSSHYASGYDAQQSARAERRHRKRTRETRSR